jgi:hypothetical protein
MWAQLVATAFGVWLMASPDVLGFEGALRTNHHIVGPLVATFACIAIAGCTRAVRWCNLPLGVWLVLAPWILGGESAATIDSILTGATVTACALVRGRVRWKYGGGWRSLWKRTDSSSSPEAAA